MSDYTHRMSLGDTAPAYRVRLRNASGVVLDLSGATAVMHVRSECALVFVSPAYPESPPTTSETVRYDWQPTDLAVIGVGRYRVSFIVTYSNGTVETIPPVKSTERLWLDVQPAA